MFLQLATIFLSSFDEVANVQNEHNQQIPAHEWNCQEIVTGNAVQTHVISAEEISFKEKYKNEIDLLRSKVGTHPGFPIPEVTFKDFFPIFQDRDTKKLLGDLLYAYCKDLDAQVVVGYDARGFPLAELLADRLNIGWVPLRKPGKLPGEVYTKKYGNEYKPNECLNLAQSAIKTGERVILIDDLIATGGTACAGIDLVRQAGGIPMLFVSVLDVPDLPGRIKVQEMGVPSFNLIDNP